MKLPRARAILARMRGRLLALALLLLLVVVRILDPPMTFSLRESLFDLYQRIEGEAEPVTDPQVVAVAIDEPSLSRYGQWPWPRSVIADLISAVAAGGPQVIGLNILLAEPDRLAPKRIVEHLKDLTEETRREILSRQSADETLAAAISKAPVVLATAVTASSARSRNLEGLAPVELVIAGDPERARFPIYGGVVRSLPVFTRAAAGEGVVSFGLGDGTVRRLPSLVRAAGTPLPSLAMEMLKLGLGADHVVVHTGPAGIERISIGAKRLPSDRTGQFRLRFRENATSSQVSAAAVLSGELPPGTFSGKYVLVGASASGLVESYATAAGTLNGLQLHAQLLESLIHSQLLLRPYWATPLELFLLLASVGLLILLLPRLPPVWEVVLLFDVLAALAGIGLAGYLAADLLIDVSWPLVSCIAAYVVLASARLIVEERGSREVSHRMRILESTLESVPVPVVVCSFFDDAILYANASAREDFGIGTEGRGIEGMTGVLRAGEDWERLLSRLHISGRVDGLEAPLNAVWGEMIGLLAARRMDYHGQDAALVACVDITQQKLMENELRSSRDEAERANGRLRDAQVELVQAEKMASLGGLVAGVAHEINTPVGIGLAGASHLVDRSREVRRQFEQEGLRRSEFLAFLETVEETSQLVTANVERAANLIQGFKRVSVDQASEQRQVFDLRDYLDDVIISLRAELNRTGTEVEVECPEGITVDSYPGAVALIVTNFVMNCLVHAFDPGEHGRIRIAARATGEEIELSCSDNGKGMSKEIVARIFDPFFTTRRGRGGSGLGLYLVFNGVTQVLRGRIEVESEEGEGTTFVVRFPRVASTAEPPLAGISTVRIEEQSKRP